MNVTIADLLDKKRNAMPVTMVTAYDFPTANTVDEAGIDAILVGDSVGTNMLGYASEREVTMADMLHHTAAVRRGATRAFILADLPYGSADTANDALANSRLLVEKGAQCVKIEGWSEMAPVIEHLSTNGITVCGHIGYNPQRHGPVPKVFGKTGEEARLLLESGRALQDAGIRLLVAEMVVPETAAALAQSLACPVIGIGSGNRCDGQVLVINDLLGITARSYRHARRYAECRRVMLDAVGAYIAEVRERRFPGNERPQARPLTA